MESHLIKEIIEQVNWVDIAVVILLLRIGCIALKEGLSVELFKFCGVFFATYITLHYYISLSDLIASRISLPEGTTAFLDFLCFVVLTVSTYLVLVLFREVFGRFIKMEAVPHLNKYGGLALGVLRGIFAAGLVVFALGISSVDYLKDSVNDSYAGRRFFKVAPGIYTWVWNNLTSKFFPQEKFNNTILEIQKDFSS